MAQLLDNHGPMVWHTVYRLVNHDADARECYQETFIAAWRTSQTQKIASWPALLKKIATNKAIDKLRERHRRQQHIQAIAINTQDSSDSDVLKKTRHSNREPSPQQAAEASELAEQLRRALPKLPDSQRTAFVLSCLEQHSNEEVAQQLGTTLKNVRVLVHRARARLRTLLEHQPSVPLVETTP